MKRFAASAIAIVLSLSLGLQADAAAFDPDRMEKIRGHVTLSVGEPGTIQNQSVLQIQPPAPGPNLEREPWRWCESLDDPVCDWSDKSLDIIGTMILPVCEGNDQENCVESLTLSREGFESKATFLRDAEGGFKWPERSSLGFFKAGSPLLFQVDGFAHGGGESTYAVIATAATKYDFESKKFFTRNLSISVVPYSVVKDPRYDPESIGSGDNNSCVFVEESSCGVREDFLGGVKLSLSVRAPSEISGWFMGRIKDPNVSIESISPRNNKISVTAEPAMVARFALIRSPESITLEDRKAMGNSGSYGSLNGIGMGTAANDQSVFGMLNYFRDEVKDTAAGVNSLWSIGTIQAPPQGCLADKSKVLGIVATNAMIYDGGTPSYENGYLKYKVGGLHYMPNGKDLVEGTYDLLMRSETARCLYGFSKAPVSATVAVVGGAGEERIATTVVSEKDGWLKLAAYGFTFSEKEVRVTLAQPQKATIARFPTGSVSLSVTQRNQILGFSNVSRNSKSFTCTVSYFSQKDQGIAKKRAQAVCANLKSRVGDSKQVSSIAIKVKSRTMDGQVALASK
jgi:hypothetical protein